MRFVDLSQEDMQGPPESEEVTRKRHLLRYLLTKAYGLSQEKSALVLKCNYSTIVRGILFVKNHQETFLNLEKLFIACRDLPRYNPPVRKKPKPRRRDKEARESRKAAWQAKLQARMNERSLRAELIRKGVIRE